jgi:hypothetical protein
VIRERRNFRNYNSNEHSTNKWHSMGTQTRQKRNGSSNWKSTAKLWSLLLPLQGLRWRTSGTNVKGHSSESASSLLFTEVTRGFLMKAAQKKERERSGIAWLTQQRRARNRRTTRTGITR